MYGHEQRPYTHMVKFSLAFVFARCRRTFLLGIADQSCVICNFRVFLRTHLDRASGYRDLDGLARLARLARERNHRYVRERLDSAGGQ